MATAITMTYPAEAIGANACCACWRECPWRFHSRWRLTAGCRSGENACGEAIEPGRCCQRIVHALLLHDQFGSPDALRRRADRFWGSRGSIGSTACGPTLRPRAMPNSTTLTELDDGDRSELGRGSTANCGAPLPAPKHPRRLLWYGPTARRADLLRLQRRRRGGSGGLAVPGLGCPLYAK